MNSILSKRNAGRVYLWLVPVLVVIFGFGLGKISYTVYLPVWILNVVLMVMASWILGLHTILDKNRSKFMTSGAFCLIVPIILVSMFFGLGPPPETPAGWVVTSAEQQIRYSMLTVAGIFIATGFTLLKEKQKAEGESYYSLLGTIAINIAIPLFILDMLFWGFSLTELFKTLVAANTEKIPEWFKPFRMLFGMISVVEVALTYLAIAFFSVSLHLTGRLSKSSRNIYVMLSLFAFLIMILSVFLPEPFVTAGYIISIPAIPFFMPYYMGISLLKTEGDKSIKQKNI